MVDSCVSHVYKMNRRQFIHSFTCKSTYIKAHYSYTSICLNLSALPDNVSLLTIWQDNLSKKIQRVELPKAEMNE